MHDGLGSTTCLTDSAANIKRSLIYSDFGERLVDTTASTVPSFNRLYAGYSWDGSPANYYWMLGRQSYDPTIGRFGQEDIIRNWWVSPKFLNFYPYVANTPTNKIDPEGKQALDCRCDPAVSQSLEDVTKLLQGHPEEIIPDPNCRGNVGVTDCSGNTPKIKYFFKEGCSTECTKVCVFAHELIHARQCRDQGWIRYYLNKELNETEAYMAQKICLERLLSGKTYSNLTPTLSFP